jgi:hypothetical protein
LEYHLGRCEREKGGKKQGWTFTKKAKKAVSGIIAEGMDVQIRMISMVLVVLVFFGAHYCS